MGLPCWARAFSICPEWELFSRWGALGPPCSGLSRCRARLSSCGVWASLLCSMWDLPGPGIEPVSPELAGRFWSTVPPGKPGGFHFICNVYSVAFNYLRTNANVCSFWVVGMLVLPPFIVKNCTKKSYVEIWNFESEPWRSSLRFAQRGLE